MAELKVTANIRPAQAQLKILDKYLSDLKKKGGEIKIEIKGADTLEKLNSALSKYSKATTDATRVLNAAQNAEAKLTNARANEIKATNQLAVEQLKLQQGQERTAQSANRLATAEQRTQQEFLKTERAASKLSSTVGNMFSQFSMANIISSGVTRAISTMRSAFNEALEEMKALDLAATHYQQVMGDETTPAATKALTQRAYSVGSKYGTSASEYMESVATYARAGYKDAADALAELSMKTVIVGQTTQEVADQFLLTMDAAYQYGGSISELSKVLDGASAIDSTYATTIEKIATGLGLVAPLANQVHTSEAELTAAIGTITAATQRSGSEAARALRSLFLNIIKDTTTEIEDGVTATEESVASVQYLLEKYAKSAMDAARATGEVVNPMEAIGALAQSMKEGLLTEQELMNLLSGIGGKLRISQLVALVQNWDMYTEMIGTYENAIGSADQKTEQYLDSWEAKTNILKNTWTEFVAKTINSDFIKGMLDAGARVIKGIGNLGNGIKMLAGIIATVKLAKAASETRAYAKALTEAGDAAKASAATMKSSILGWSALAIGAITTVISAYSAYHNQRMQQLTEERDKQIQEAETQVDSLNNINEAYDAYNVAKIALDNGKISTEEYETAVRNLAEALGIENDLLADNISYIERRKEAQKQATLSEIEDALAWAKITADAELGRFSMTRGARRQGNASSATVYNEATNEFELDTSIPYARHYALIGALDAAKTAEEALPIYEELKDVEAEFLEQYKLGGEYAQEYGIALEEVRGALSDYADVLEPMSYWQDQQAEAMKTSAERLKEAAQTAREAAEEQLLNKSIIWQQFAQQKQLDKYFLDPSNVVSSSPYGDWERHYPLYQKMDEAKSIDELIPIYKKLTSVAADYNEKAQEGGENADKYASAYEELISVLSLYAPTLEEAIRAMAEANGEEYFNSFEAAINGTAKSVDETARTFHGLADAIKSADNALADYQKRTESEKDDDYKKYAEAWQAAFEDITSGRRNSNTVNAALDLFFTPEQLMNMRKNGIQAADLIASDFFREIFTYMDGENMQFTKGEDAGSLLAYYLWDNDAIGEYQEDGKKVIKLGDDIAATFEDVGGQLQISVTDVEMLSDALGQMGIIIDPDVLTVWLEALGVFTDGFMYSADVVKEFANDVGALKDEKIDLESLIVGQLQLGKTTEDVADLLDAVVAMADSGDIELTVTGEELDTTIENCKDLIANRDDLDDSSADVEVNADTKQATSALDLVRGKLQGVAKTWTSTVTVNTTGLSSVNALLSNLNAIASHPALSARGYASGTPSANGGLALVNEEAPELIVENGAARIAGSGMPTLTYLKNGATVFNARETKSILGGSYPSALFDGINAYASGANLGYNVGGISRWTPASSGTSSGSTASTTSSASASSSYSNTSTSSSSSSSSSSSDKDPQLEALKNRVSLLKSELSLLEERDVSLDDQIDKQREIQKALQDEIIYLGSIGGDQAEINNLWTEYWKIENDVRSDRLGKAKGELEVLEAADRPIREQIEKQREIATIYKEKLDILQQTGGSQIEINNLLKEELAIQESITKLNKQLMSDLGDAIGEEIDKLNDERDEFVDGLQKEIDALKAEREAQQELNQEEELNQKLIEARNNLLNSQNERTVRMYNAATGQWEWVADAQQVKSAQEAYASAQQALADYQDEAAFNAKIDALVAEQEKYTQLYADKTDKWEEILESMEDPIMTIAEALKAIEDNATRDMQGQINDLNRMLTPLGYSISTANLYDSGGILSGLGGIKATARDEAVLPPDVTARLLKPIQPAVFEQRMNELKYLYGANGNNFTGSMGGSVGSQHNGDLYTFGNVTLTTEQAQNTTIYDFVQAAKALRSYSGRM